MRVPCYYIFLAGITFSQPRFSFAQILNIDKTDTNAYQHNGVLNPAIGSGLEIDKQKITVYDATNTLDAALQKLYELIIFSSSVRFTYNGPEDILNTAYFHLRFRHHYKNRLH